MGILEIGTSPFISVTSQGTGGKPCQFPTLFTNCDAASITPNVQKTQKPSDLLYRKAAPFILTTDVDVTVVGIDDRARGFLRVFWLWASGHRSFSTVCLNIGTRGVALLVASRGKPGQARENWWLMFPTGLWQSVHIDDLQKSTVMIADVTKLQDVAISQLFEPEEKAERESRGSLWGHSGDGRSGVPGYRCAGGALRCHQGQATPSSH